MWIRNKRNIVDYNVTFSQKTLETVNVFRLQLMTQWLTFTYYFTKLYCHVLPTSINSFNVKSNKLIKCMTRTNVSCQNLHPTFVKPSIVQNHIDSGNSFSTLSLVYQDQWNDTELGIRITIQQKHKRLLHDGDIDQNDAHKFFDSVHNFFVKLYNYCVEWLPLDICIYKTFSTHWF